jgi:hypothetical protein
MFRNTDVVEAFGLDIVGFMKQRMDQGPQESSAA